MDGRVLLVRKLSDGDEQAWTDLAARAVEPNPFHEPDCVVAAAQHQTFGDEVKLVVAEEDGRFFGCLPLRHLRKRWHKLPYQLATTRVRRMNYLGTPLVDPARGLEAASTLLATVADECRAAGSVAAEIWDVTAGGAVDRLLREAAGTLGLPFRVTYGFDRGVLTREDALANRPLHSSKTLRSLRKKRHGLERALGGEITLVDRGSDLSAIDDYIELEASGYKTDIGVAMTTVPGEPEYFTEMCRRFAAANRFHLLSLTVGSKTVAMMAWVRGGDSIFLFKCSYDAGYAKFSPGLQLHMAGIEHFRDHTNAALLDTCAGPNNELVFGTYPGRRRLNTYTLAVPRGIREKLVTGLVGDGRLLRTRLAERFLPERRVSPPPGHRAAGR